jgi:hypothetical protein
MLHGTQRRDAGMFPTQTAACEACLTDERAGAFQHPGTERPASSLKERRGHEEETCAHRARMLVNVLLAGLRKNHDTEGYGAYSMSGRSDSPLVRHTLVKAA